MLKLIILVADIMNGTKNLPESIVLTAVFKIIIKPF
jgi:hypothetical protein